jgi:hypothetical protein
MSPSSNSQEAADALVRRRGSKIDTDSALGANSDIETILLGGNLQQHIFGGRISMGSVLGFAAL